MEEGRRIVRFDKGDGNQEGNGRKREEKEKTNWGRRESSRAGMGNYMRGKGS